MVRQMGEEYLSGGSRWIGSKAKPKRNAVRHTDESSRRDEITTRDDDDDDDHESQTTPSSRPVSRSMASGPATGTPRLLAAVILLHLSLPRPVLSLLNQTQMEALINNPCNFSMKRHERSVSPTDRQIDATYSRLTFNVTPDLKSLYHDFNTNAKFHPPKKLHFNALKRKLQSAKDIRKVRQIQYDTLIRFFVLFDSYLEEHLNSSIKFDLIKRRDILFLTMNLIKQTLCEIRSDKTHRVRIRPKRKQSLAKKLIQMQNRTSEKPISDVTKMATMDQGLVQNLVQFLKKSMKVSKALLRKSKKRT